MDLEKFQIWRPETGILGLPSSSVSELNPPNIGTMKRDWTELKKAINAAGAEIQSEFDKKFNEKLYREWSIETGQIEGLFVLDRGVTTSLIEHGFNDPRLIPHGGSDKSPEYILQIVKNHREVLEDGIYGFVKQERQLSTSYIKELHQALTKFQPTTEVQDQSGKIFDIELLRGEWKKLPNFPLRDGIIYEYCPPVHVASEMERLMEEYNKLVEFKFDAISRAAWLHHRFSQIHPFQDGNGRVSRALASIILIQDGLFPFTVTMESRADYLQVLEQADQTKDVTDSAKYLMPLIHFIASRQFKDYSQASLIGMELLTPIHTPITKFVANKETELKKIMSARQLGEKLINLINNALAPLRNNYPSLSPELKKEISNLIEKLSTKVIERNLIFSPFTEKTTERILPIDYDIKYSNTTLFYSSNYDNYKGNVTLIRESTFHSFEFFLSDNQSEGKFLIVISYKQKQVIDSNWTVMVRAEFSFFVDEELDLVQKKFDHWIGHVIPRLYQLLDENLK
ncbi:MAG: Fic family protein [Alphaproteobacteria bacterium]|nr:Fic family protein [Alphaproteobacteria bacterium]